MMSVTPPGAYGTTILTVRLGYSEADCAPAPKGAMAATRASASAMRPMETA